MTWFPRVGSGSGNGLATRWWSRSVPVLRMAILMAIIMYVNGFQSAHAAQVHSNVQQGATARTQPRTGPAATLGKILPVDMVMGEVSSRHAPETSSSSSTSPSASSFMEAAAKVSASLGVGAPSGKACNPSTQRWDCRPIEACIDGKCAYCNRSDQCTDWPAFECQWADGSKHNVCHHKALFPSVSDVDIITSILAFIFCAMAGGGGVGGGSLLVPIFVVINRFLPSEAIPLSKATIFAGSIGNLLLNIFKSHPYDERRVLIDYETATVLEPIAMYGTVIGVVLTRTFPDWFIFIALVTVLFFMSWKTIVRAISLYRIETIEKERGPSSSRRGTGSDIEGGAGSGSDGEGSGTDDDGPRRPQMVDASTSPMTPSTPVEARQSFFPTAAAGGAGASDDAPSSSAGRRTVTASTSTSTGTDDNLSLGVGAGDEHVEQDDDADVTASDSSSLLSRRRGRPAGSGDSNDVLDGSSAGSTSSSSSSPSSDGQLERVPTLLANVERYGPDKDTNDEDYDPTLTCIDPSIPALLPPTSEEERQEREAELAEYHEELTKHSLLSYIILLICDILIVLIMIFLGGEGNASIIGVECGSTAYWLLWLSLFPFVILLTYLMARRARNRYVRKVQLGFPFLRGDVMWTTTSLIIYPFVSFSAGIAAGMIGVGGGTIMAPMLLDLGLLPGTTAATVAYMILFTSSCTTSQFLVHGMLQYDYAGWYAGIGFIATIVGQIVTLKIVNAYGRPSILVFTIAAVTALGSAMLTVQGSFQLADDIDHDKHMGFRNMCD